MDNDWALERKRYGLDFLTSEQVELHKDKQVLVLPTDVKGIHNTRKWIYEHAKDSVWGMYDDDLSFIKRNGSKKTVMNEDDWKDMLDRTYHWLTTDASFAGHRLSFLPPSGQDYRENSAIHCACYFNGKVIPKFLDWSIPLAEDLHMFLQLLKSGFNNKVWEKYSVDNKAYADGGCNTFRNIEMINECHTQLIGEHPEFVQNMGLTKTKMGDMIKIKVFWNKAYRSSQIGSLKEFMS